MALIPTNSVGGYSTGLTMTSVIDALGNITGVTGTFTKTLTGTTATFTGLVSSTVGFSGSGTNITGLVSSFNGLTGAVTGVTVGGTNVFTALNSFNAGISASALTVAGGATFSGNVYADNILDVGIGTLSLNDKADTRVAIGDYSVNGNATYIYLRNTNSTLDISNPLGSIYIGDPNGISSGYSIVYNSSAGSLDGGNSDLTNFYTGSFNGLLTASAGISAAGGVTFGGTVASDTGYRITSNAIKAQTGTTYTFLESDNGKVLTFNNGSAVTVTIPTELPVGFNCTAIQLGAGQVGFTAASGLTLQSYGNQYRLIGQNAAASIIEYSANIVNLSGNLVV